MKKYNFLNINPSNMIVLKFHMLLLYTFIIKQFQNNVLVGENKYQSYVYFQAFKKVFFFCKNHVFLENFIVNTF